MQREGRELLFAAQIGGGIVVIANEEDEHHAVGIDNRIFQAVARRQIKLPDCPIYLFNRPMGCPASFGVSTKDLPNGVLFLFAKAGDDPQEVLFMRRL